MKKENVVLFAFAVSFALLLSTIVFTKNDDDDTTAYDLSGHGICSNNTINVTNASYWVQFPSRNQPPMYYNNKINANFIGRNAIVWNENGSMFKTFEIANVSTPLIYSTQDLRINGSCHFTLDSTALGYLAPPQRVSHGTCKTYFDVIKPKKEFLLRKESYMNDVLFVHFNGKPAPYCNVAAGSTTQCQYAEEENTGLNFTGYCVNTGSMGDSSLGAQLCPIYLPCLQCDSGYYQKPILGKRIEKSSVCEDGTYQCQYECARLPTNPPQCRDSCNACMYPYNMTPYTGNDCPFSHFAGYQYTYYNYNGSSVGSASCTYTDPACPLYNCNSGTGNDYNRASYYDNKLYDNDFCNDGYSSCTWGDLGTPFIQACQRDGS